MDLVKSNKNKKKRHSKSKSFVDVDPSVLMLRTEIPFLSEFTTFVLVWTADGCRMKLPTVEAVARTTSADPTNFISSVV